MVALMLSIASVVFIVIALYVGAVVTANSFATIIAGRTRTIALLRLLGSSARAQRGAIAREGLLVGIVGSLLGVVVGIGITAVLLNLGVSSGASRDALPLPRSRAHPARRRRDAHHLGRVVGRLAAGARGVADRGDRRIPRALAPRTSPTVRRATARRSCCSRSAPRCCCSGRSSASRPRSGSSIGLVGGHLLVHRSRAGGRSDHRLQPSGWSAELLGRGPTGRLAAENAVRYPERSTRTTIGVVIGVALVTMFAVALGTYSHLIAARAAGAPRRSTRASRRWSLVREPHHLACWWASRR